MVKIRLVIAARDTIRAAEVAQRLQIDRREWVLLNGIYTLATDMQVPLYVDPSWPGHVWANGVQDAIELRMTALLGPPKTNLGHDRKPLRAT